MSTQISGEYRLAVATTPVFGQGRESGTFPRRGVALDDERAATGGVAIMVGDKNAVGVLAKRERERVEALRRSVPHVTVRKESERRFERIAVGFAHDAVDPVRPDNQIAVRESSEVREPALELQAHVSAVAVILEHSQQFQTGDSREADAVDSHPLVAVNDQLIVPGLQAPVQVGVRVGICILKERQCAVREHHTETERGSDRVLLHDPNLVRGVEALHQQGKIQPRWSAANDADPHSVRILTVRPASGSMTRERDGGETPQSPAYGSSTATRRLL